MAEPTSTPSRRRPRRRPASTLPAGATRRRARPRSSPRSTGRRWRSPPSAACSTSSPSRTRFGLQSSKFGGPDGRTDQVRGRLDAVLIASLIGPVTRHIGLVPTAVTDPHRAVPPRIGDLHARLRQQRARRMAAAGVGPAVRGGPRRAPHVRAVRADRTRRPGRRPTRPRPVRRGDRRGRGRPPAVGQLGGRRRSSRTSPPGASSTATSCTTSTSKDGSSA